MSSFSDPQKNIDQCGIQVGQIIADFGVGSGAYALLAARALMSTGKVYAIDVQEGLVTRLQKEAKHEKLLNIDGILGNVEVIGGTKLADGTVNLVLMSNLLFQIEDKKNMLAEAKRILVPGGRVMVIEWSDSFAGIGPHKDTVVSKQACLDLFEHSGFIKDRDMSTGIHQYGFIFKKL